MTALEVSGLAAWNLREPVSKRTYAIVQVTTAGGLAGWGECAAATVADAAQARVALSGKQATAWEAIRKTLSPALAGGVNMALLDIVGKNAKAPVHQVLGGPTRHKVRALAAGPVNAARAAGYRAFRLPAPSPRAMNHGQAYVLAVRKTVEDFRAAAPDCDFILDGGAGLSPGDAGAIASEIESAHPLWFDEPCRPSNLAALRKIAAERVTPLGFGRTAPDAAFFQELLREEVIDVLRPSLARHGVSSIRKMAAIAETYYVAVAPYHDGGPVGTAAALHLAAALPNFFIQQIPFPEADEDRRMRAAIAGASIETVQDGFAALPSGPGLGIAVDESALAKYGERVA
jgi:galactonate dehydratase